VRAQRDAAPRQLTLQYDEFERMMPLRRQHVRPIGRHFGDGNLAAVAGIVEQLHGRRAKFSHGAASGCITLQKQHEVAVLYGGLSKGQGDAGREEEQQI